MNLPTIYLLRHGQTQWNVEGRYQGQLDSPLTKKGEEQAKKNAQKLKKHLDISDVKFFSSPLGRAKESSYIICNELNIEKNKIIFDERISEFSYGIFEGKTKKECKVEYPEIVKDREENKWFYKIENGDSYSLVKRRVLLWLESISKESLIVLVAHEMVNRVIRGIYCNLDINTILELRQPNDVILKLENYKEKIVK